MSLLTDWVMGHNKSVLPERHRTTHTYVIGQPGAGKSRCLESWIMQDIAAGRGVGVIDPHGELFRNLLHRLASHPETWDRIILLDPLDSKWTIGFNPLESDNHFQSQRLALYMTDVAMKIWNINAGNAPRMLWLLTNTFLALSERGLSLLELPRFLTDSDFRSDHVSALKNVNTRNYFFYEFPESEAARNQWIAPVLNKIGGLIFDPDIRLIFSGNSTINFHDIMDDQKILLVNLPKGTLGEAPSALIAAFLVAHIQKSALARNERGTNSPFYLYLDEFQNYTTDNIKDILSESRKYALSLTLAHQYLDQLTGDLQSAVLNTAGTMVSFRIGYNDALRIAKEIFPSPDYIKTQKTNLRFRRFQGMSLPYIISKDDPLGWNGLALELSNLPFRQFWARKRGPFRPTKQRTFDMPSPQLTRQVIQNTQQLRDMSGQRYGIEKNVLRQRLYKRQETDQGPADIPVWSN